MDKTVFALFDSRDHAVKARKDLLDAGFNNDQVEMEEQQPGAAGAKKSGGLVERFRHLFLGEDRDYYEEATRRGGVLLTVTAGEERLEKGVDILERHDPVDLARRVEEWRQTGWKSTAAEGRQAGAPKAAAPRAKGAQEEKIPVVEEHLQVGTQREIRGGVRIYSRVTETPVQQDVTLREEKVDVQRRPADRPASQAEMRERTVEMTEMHEEPVVRKEARVVEEIILRKDVKERTETVKETVRKTDVNVEQLDRDFRQDFDKRFAGRGYTYEQSRAAYQYGVDLANDPRYHGKSWNEFEPEARRHFEERNPGRWEEFKEAVHSAFDRAHGRKAA